MSLISVVIIDAIIYVRLHARVYAINDIVFDVAPITVPIVLVVEVKFALVVTFELVIIVHMFY